MTMICHEFLQILVESQRATDARLWAIDIEVATLYGQIRPWVWTRLENAEARWDVAHRVAMSELCVNLQAHIDSFERCITAQFVEIEMSDLDHMREMVDTL